MNASSIDSTALVDWRVIDWLNALGPIDSFLDSLACSLFEQLLNRLHIISEDSDFFPVGTVFDILLQGDNLIITDIAAKITLSPDQVDRQSTSHPVAFNRWQPLTLNVYVTPTISQAETHHDQVCLLTIILSK